MAPMSVGRQSTGAHRNGALKLLGAIDAESAIAINESSIATRAMWTGKTVPGDMAGELLRSFQYKGVATSAMLESGWRLIDARFDKTGTIPRRRFIRPLAIEGTGPGGMADQ